MPGQCRSDGVGVLVHQFDQHHVAGVSLHQRGNLAVGIAEQQITLPVPRHCPILDAGRPFADGHGVNDPAMDGGFLGVVA